MNNTPHCFVVMNKLAYNSMKSILEGLVYRITYSNCLLLLVLLTKTSPNYWSFTLSYYVHIKEVLIL